MAPDVTASSTFRQILTLVTTTRIYEFAFACIECILHATYMYMYLLDISTQLACMKLGRREKYQPIQYCWAGCLGYPVHTCHLPIDIQQIYCSAQTGQHLRLRCSCCPVWALHIYVFTPTYSVHMYYMYMLHHVHVLYVHVLHVHVLYVHVLHVHVLYVHVLHSV